MERIDRLAHGNAGDAKPVGQGVSELRLTYGPGYRIYWPQDGDNMVLLLLLLLRGGDKSTQQADITKAHELADEWHSKEDDTDEEE